MFTFFGRFGKKKKKRPFSFPSPTTNFIKDVGTHTFEKRKRYSFFGKNIQNISFLYAENKITLFLGMFLILILIGTGVLLGPFLRVQEILISKQDIITNIEQAYSSVEYIRGKNILFLEKGELVNRLQNGQNTLQNIEIQIHLPATIVIELTSSPPVFQTSEHFVLSNGILVEKGNKDLPELQHLSIISKNSDIFLFGNGINANDVENIKKLLGEITQNITSFTPQKLAFYETEKELLLSDAQGTIFLFDMSGDTLQQVQQLGMLQKEKKELYSKKYIYIDVRVPHKLFLCGFEEEFSCRKNLKNIYGEEVFMNSETSVSK